MKDKLLTVTLLLLLMLTSVTQVNAADSKDWTLKLTPAVGGTRGTAVTLGEAIDANNEMDHYDAPVLALSQSVTAYFDHAGWQRRDENYWYDIKSFGADRLWVLTTSSNRVGETFSLDWQSNTLPAGHDVILVDVDSGQIIDMVNQSSYAFQVTDPSPRFFTIKVFNTEVDDCTWEDAAGRDPDGNGCTDGVKGIDLSVAIEGNQSTVLAGNELIYRITVKNRGDINADSLLVSLDLDADVTFVKATRPCTLAVSDNMLTCDVGIVPIDGSAVLDVTVVPDSEGMLLQSVAIMTPLPGDTDPVDDSMNIETRVLAAVTVDMAAAAGASGSGGSVQTPLMMLMLMYAGLLLLRRYQRRQKVG